MSTTSGFSDDQLLTIRQMWLDGYNDSDIGAKIDRSTRAVRNQRSIMQLTRQNYPNRPIRSGCAGTPVTRTYTADEEHDILSSIDRGESLSSIAARYHVGSRTMEKKVDRLLIRDPVYEPTSRTCLVCRRPFMSGLPRKINRMCPECLTA